MLLPPGSELALSRGSRRREEQNYIVGSTAPIFLPYFLPEGFIRLDSSRLPPFSSSPPLLITTSFLFPYSHSGFPLFSCQIFSFSSFFSPGLAIPFFFPLVILAHLTHKLSPYSFLLFHGPFQSELKLLHR